MLFVKYYDQLYLVIKLGNLSFKDVVHLSMVNWQLYSFCNRKKLWKFLSERDYPDIKKIGCDWEDERYKEFYINRLVWDRKPSTPHKKCISTLPKTDDEKWWYFSCCVCFVSLNKCTHYIEIGADNYYHVECYEKDAKLCKACERNMLNVDVCEKCGYTLCEECNEYQIEIGYAYSSLYTMYVISKCNKSSCNKLVCESNDCVTKEHNRFTGYTQYTCTEHDHDWKKRRVV